MPLDTCHAGAGLRTENELFSPARFAAILGVLIFLSFPDVILGWKTFYHHDFAIFGYPLAFYHRECFWRGELPMWNPLNDCGVPFLAQWNTATLYPGSLFYLLFPLSWSLGVFCVAHLFVAGMGMYFLAWEWTKHRLAAAAGGIAFAFGGLSLSCLVWPSNMATLAWMPWVVWALERGLAEGRRHLLLAVLLGSLQMLTGSPETIAFTWAVAAAVFAGKWLFREQGRWVLTLRFAVVAAWIALMCAAQLLPFLELLRLSQRDADYGDFAYSMPGTGWANLLIPLFRCHESRYGVFFQAGQGWISSYYPGIGVTALAAAAVWGRRTWRTGVAGLLALGGLVLAAGVEGGVYPVLRKIFPALGLMNFPVKFVVLTGFCLPLLAAVAVAGVCAGPEQRKDGERRNPWDIVLLGTGAVLSALMIVSVAMDHAFPLMGADPVRTLWNAAGRWVFLCAILAALICLPSFQEGRLRRFLPLAFLLLFVAEIFTGMPPQNPTVERNVYGPELPRPDMNPKPQFGESRAWLDADTHNALARSNISSPATHILGMRLLLFANLNLLEGIPKVDGFYPLHLRESSTIRTLLGVANRRKSGPAFDFVGVSFLPAAGRTLEWEPRPGALPLVTGGQSPVFVDGNRAIDLLFATNFAPTAVVYLPPEARTAVRALNGGSVRILESRPSMQRVDITAEAGAPGWVVIAQNWHPAWRAYVDGQSVPLWKANAAFQALEIPAGRHKIKVAYEDAAFRLGAGLSLSSLLCWIAVWRRWRAHEDKTANPANGG